VSDTDLDNLIEELALEEEEIEDSSMSEA